MYKAFVRPHLDYSVVIYNETCNKSFHKNLESFQYNGCPALLGAITGLPREKIYYELGPKSLQHWHLYNKICLFYKIFRQNKPVYIFNLIPAKNLYYNTRKIDKVTLLILNITFSKKYSFPSTVVKWNKLEPNLRSVASLSVFKKNLLKFIRPSPDSVFNCCNCKGIKYFARVRLDLSHLCEHKFKHIFEDTLSPFACVALITSMHFFFFITPCSVIQDIPSWAQLMILIVIYQILMIRYWLTLFLSVKLL